MALDLDFAITQEKFGDLVGISQQAVSDLLLRGVLQRGHSAGEWLHAYCANLREQAAGRASTGDLDLVQERARLAKEQADKVAMANAQARKELAPVAALEYALATMGRQVAAILEALPIQIKRTSKTLSSDDYRLLVDEITKARNVAAHAELILDDDHGSDGNSTSD